MATAVYLTEGAPLACMCVLLAGEQGYETSAEEGKLDKITIIVYLIA